MNWLGPLALGDSYRWNKLERRQTSKQPTSHGAGSDVASVPHHDSTICGQPYHKRYQYCIYAYQVTVVPTYTTGYEASNEHTGNLHNRDIPSNSHFLVNVTVINRQRYAGTKLGTISPCAITTHDSPWL